MKRTIPLVPSTSENTIHRIAVTVVGVRISGTDSQSKRDVIVVERALMVLSVKYPLMTVSIIHAFMAHATISSMTSTARVIRATLEKIARRTSTTVLLIRAKMVSVWI